MRKGAVCLLPGRAPRRPERLRARGEAGGPGGTWGVPQPPPRGSPIPDGTGAPGSPLPHPRRCRAARVAPSPRCRCGQRTPTPPVPVYPSVSRPRRYRCVSPRRGGTAPACPGPALPRRHRRALPARPAAPRGRCGQTRGSQRRILSAAPGASRCAPASAPAEASAPHPAQLRRPLRPPPIPRRGGFWGGQRPRRPNSPDGQSRRRFPAPGAPAERCAGAGGRAPGGVSPFPGQPGARQPALGPEKPPGMRGPFRRRGKPSPGVGRAARAALRTRGGAAGPMGRCGRGKAGGGMKQREPAGLLRVVFLLKDVRIHQNRTDRYPSNQHVANHVSFYFKTNIEHSPVIFKFIILFFFCSGVKNKNLRFIPAFSIPRTVAIF